jgi:hypothetical protein
MKPIAVTGVICLASAAILTGCGKEFDRIPAGAVQTYEKEISVEANSEIQFWVDLDVEYGEPFSFIYHIELYEGDKQVAVQDCDVMNVSMKIMALETKVNGRGHTRYQGKLNLKYKAPAAGKLKVKATPVINGELTRLGKCDLVFKK